MANDKWVETTNARIRLRDDGIVEFRAYNGADDTLETAQENMAVFNRLLGERAPGPILVFIAGIKSQSRDARAFLSKSDESLKTCSRVALVVDSPLSRALGNVFIGLSKSRSPLKLFNSEQEAVLWLKQDQK